MAINKNKEFSDNYAYDLHKDVLSKGEVYDEDVIKQSVEVIIATILGERLFFPEFGTTVWSKLFENMDESTGENLIDELVVAIKRWEDRIFLLERDIQLDMYPDENSMIIDIPFVIVRTGKKSRFKKKIFV
jgi:phage baseplate assembly protein W